MLASKLFVVRPKLSGVATAAWRNLHALRHNIESSSKKTVTANPFKFTLATPVSSSHAVPRFLVGRYASATAAAQHALSNTRKDEAYKHHNHTAHWAAERIVAAALVGLIPAAFFIHHPVLDYSMALLLGAHTYWGFEGIVADYMRPQVFGQAIATLSIIFIRVFGAIMFAGLIHFCYNDVGLIQATKMLWSL